LSIGCQSSLVIDLTSNLPKKVYKDEVLADVKKEVEGLIEENFICPYRYAEWISNIVPVYKKNRKMRVCIDFRDLNRAAPMDEYPMPVAHLLVDAAAGHKVISFMDGNVGYNLIFMAVEDVAKTAFRCPGHIGLFEWIVMTFGLNNAGANYQRVMNYIFHELIGKIVEIYIDDIVIKSLDHESRLAGVGKTLECTRKQGLKMNPNKCAFGVSTGEFLGFLVHEGGIEVGNKSMKAIDEVVPPTNIKGLQSLLGKINFVRRFISNLSQKVFPFFPLLRVKKDQKFVWGDEQQKAFNEIKEYMKEPPVLVPPQLNKPFRLCVAADT
jgi:hypothetical protein